MFDENKKYPDLINSIKTPSVADALDILSKAGEEDIFEKAHQVGDVHPNGKWVWVQLPNGKFDWRTMGGRAHTRHNEAQKNKENEGKNSGEPKTLDEHAADTPTDTLKKVVDAPNAPEKLKDAAKKELSKRDKEGGEQENPEVKPEQNKEETPAAKPEKNKQTESTQTDDGVKTMKAPRTVYNSNSLEKWAKKKYPTAVKGNSYQDEKSRSVDSCWVKDKKGNVFTIAFTSNNDFDKPTEEIHIIPGQHRLTLDKEGKIKKGKVHRLDKI